MASTFQLKICNLPIQCPGDCGNMREVQDQSTGNYMTFCGESDRGTCPFSTKIEVELTGPIEPAITLT